MRMFVARMVLTASTLLILFQPAFTQTLKKESFHLKNQAEVLLALTASAPQTSWSETGSEAAVASLFVDGQYNQDIILFAGARSFTYEVMLGHLQSGEHTLRIDFNRKQ